MVMIIIDVFFPKCYMFLCLVYSTYDTTKETSCVCTYCIWFKKIQKSKKERKKEREKVQKSMATFAVKFIQDNI